MTQAMTIRVTRHGGPEVLEAVEAAVKLARVATKRRGSTAGEFHAGLAPRLVRFRLLRLPPQLLVPFGDQLFGLGAGRGGLMSVG